MATLTYDSELMTQQVAAVPVPNSSKFVTVRDERGLPMLFSCGTDGILYAFKENTSGARVMVNLSNALRVAPAKVNAFELIQDKTTNTLYLVVAIQSGTQSQLIVVRPFQPELINVTNANLDMSKMWIPQTDTQKMTISSIYMSPMAAGLSYPQIVLGYVPLDKVHQTADLGCVEMDSALTGWHVDSDLSLPENAAQIVDFCLGVLPIGRGYFTLYTIQGQTQLVFATTDRIDGIRFQVSLKCPAGAKCLSTFADADGYTSLLVGGQGLWYWTATDAQFKGRPGKQISADPAFDGVLELFVVQAGKALSIFTSNSSQAVSYTKTPNFSPTATLKSVPLLPSGQGGLFSPFLSADGLTLQLIVSNNAGVLTLLQQDPVTGIWSKSPFYIPSLSKNINFSGYMTHVSLKAQNKSALANQLVTVKSSGWVDIIVNGRNITVGPTGVRVLTDNAGTLTLLIPTEDISTYTFKIGNPGGDYPPIFAGDWEIDPADKIHTKLTAIKTGNDLRNAQLQSGAKLLDGTKVPQADIDKAAAAISTLITQRPAAKAAARAAVAPELAAPTDHRLMFAPGKVRSGEDLGWLMSGQNTSRIAAASSITDMAWEAWHWLTKQVEKFASWAVEKAIDGLKFVVEIGGKFMRWALNGLTEIAKAISWVFDKVLDIAGKVIDWLGFIFNWGDIQATHKSIVAVVNSGLNAGSARLQMLAAQVDKFFTDIETQVRNAIYPSKLTSSVAGPSATDDPTIASQKAAQASTQGNYSNYQFTHGGAAANSVVSGTETDNPLYAAWTDLIKPAFDSLERSISTLSSDVVLLFTKNGNSLSVGEVLQKMGADVIIGIIDAIKVVVVGLIKLGATILADFKKFINYKINIPIFSALYKEFLSGGTDLTLLDGLALILAIPVTILCKLVTGSKPPDLTGLDIGALLDGKVTDQNQLLGVNKFMGFTTMTTHTLDGLLSVFDALPVGVVGRSAVHAGLSTNMTFGGAPQALALNHSALSLRDPSAQLGKFAAPHPLTSYAAFVKSGNTGALRAAGLNLPIATDWKLALGVVSKIASIPTNLSLPAPVLRWLSWLIGCANTLIRAAIRKLDVSGVPATAKAKALAVIEAANGIINFALVCAINGIEFNTDNFPGKDVAITTFQTIQSVFDVISTEAGAAAVLIDEPMTKAACEVGSLAAMAFSGIITGSTVTLKAAQGKYNYLLTYIS